VTARFEYFSEKLTDAASKWCDSLNLANYAKIDLLYTDFLARFAFNVTDQWQENQIFRQTKQGNSELSTDFIRKVEAESVQIKATAADIRDTILQVLLPAILNRVMQHKLGAGLNYISKWAKITKRYGNTTLKSEKDISEIKSTLNDLATRLDRTQLKAVTPEPRTVQFTESAPTNTYSRDTSPAAPIKQFWRTFPRQWRNS